MPLSSGCQRVGWILTCGVLAAPLAAAEPLHLGDRRELFVDQYLIERLEGARFELHEPRDEGPVLALDAAWEGPQSGYGTVLKDGDRYLLIYRGLPIDGRDGSDAEVTCVALSDDGLHWTKPQLNLFNVQSHATNNVILAGAAPFSHNFCPFLDERPGVPSEERFKALAGVSDSGLVAWVSADGLRWHKLRDEPVITSAQVTFPHVHLFDSQNLAFWSASEGCYVSYFRVWDGLRRIARTTSPDFVNWSPASLMQQDRPPLVASSLATVPEEHLYTNQTSPYYRAPHIYLATAARFMPGRAVLTAEEAAAINVDPDYFQDTSDAVLLTSRGGTRYDRTFLGALLRPGIGPQNWVSRTNYPVLNLVPTGPTEISMYVNQDYAQPTAHIRRYSLRMDGLASIRAGVEGGELLTHPLTFSGNRLSLNFATSAAGGIRLELQTAAGEPVPGFALADSIELIGNEIERIARWKGGNDVGSLAGQPIRLRMVLQDADLYSLRFQQP